MNDKFLDIFIRSFRGEEVTDKEKEELMLYDMRYALVRFLYLEKMNSNLKDDEPKLTDFHFSPGSAFMETPIYDILKNMIELDLEDLKEKARETFLE